MKISSNGQHRWILSFSQELAKQVDASLQNIQDEARRTKTNNTWKAAVAKILADPLVVGGPRFRYHKMGLTNFIYTSEFFILHYAVDETRHIVYLRKFILNP